MNSKKLLAHIIDSEHFKQANRNYFFDLRRARTDQYFICITRSDKQNGDNFERTKLVVFEDDLPFFVEALSMLLRRYSHGEIPVKK